MWRPCLGCSSSIKPRETANPGDSTQFNLEIRHNWLALSGISWNIFLCAVPFHWEDKKGRLKENQVVLGTQHCVHSERRIVKKISLLWGMEFQFMTLAMAGEGMLVPGHPAGVQHAREHWEEEKGPESMRRNSSHFRVLDTVSFLSA